MACGTTHQMEIRTLWYPTYLTHGTLAGEIAVETRYREDPWTADADPHQLKTVLLNQAIKARDCRTVAG